MSSATLNSELLMRELDTLKSEFFPLQAHALREVDLHTREMYASVLAAVLLVDGKVSAGENRLFSMLLSSLGLDGIQARMFEQACALDSAQLCEFLRVIEEAKAEGCFILDALVLCRIEGQLSDLQTQLLAELLEFLQLPEHELAALVFWASKILRLPVEIEVPKAARQTLLIAGFDGQSIEHYEVEKILINKGECIKKLQAIARIQRSVGMWSFPLPEQIESRQDGLVYDISIQKNEETGQNRMIGSILPFSSSTKVWLEFI